MLVIPLPCVSPHRIETSLYTSSEGCLQGAQSLYRGGKGEEWGRGGGGVCRQLSHSAHYQLICWGCVLFTKNLRVPSKQASPSKAASISVISCVWDIHPVQAGLAFLSFILFPPQMPSYSRFTLLARKTPPLLLPGCCCSHPDFSFLFKKYISNIQIQGLSPSKQAFT